MKTCKRCAEVKESSGFAKHSGFKDGLNTVCKLCKSKESLAAYHARTPEEKLADKRRWKNNWRKWAYGVNHEQYEAMRLARESKCDICGTEYPNLNLDHCHASGAVRGLLCTSCNTALGKFKDSPVLLNKAIQYLAKGTVC